MVPGLKTEVFLDQKDGTYYQGQRVTGTVRLTFEKRTLLKCISVRLIGNVSVLIGQYSGNIIGDATIVDKQAFIFPKIRNVGSLLLIDTTFTRDILIERGTVLNESFDFQLKPKATYKDLLPPSFSFQNPPDIANAVYSIRVECHRGSTYCQRSGAQQIKVNSRIPQFAKQSSFITQISQTATLQKFEDDRERNRIKRLIYPKKTASRKITFRLAIVLPCLIEHKQTFRPKIFLLSDMDPCAFRNGSAVGDLQNSGQNPPDSNGKGVLYLTSSSIKLVSWTDMTVNMYRTRRSDKFHLSKDAVSPGRFKEIDLSQLVPISQFKDQNLIKFKNQPFAASFIMDISHRFPELVIPECQPSVETTNVRHTYNFEVQVTLRGYPTFGKTLLIKADSECTMV